MQAKMTPGPWRVRPNDECSKIENSKGHLLAMCSYVHSRGRRDPEEVGANARAISQVPALVEAARMLVDMFDKAGYIWADYATENKFPTVIAQFRAALAIIDQK